MYRMSGFAVKLNIQNFVNSMGNCVHYKCTEYLIRKKIKYPKFHKFNGKLCTLYMYKLSGFTEKLNIQTYVNSTGNYVRYSYGMSGFADKLTMQNYVNLIRNSVH